MIKYKLVMESSWASWCHFAKLVSCILQKSESEKVQEHDYLSKERKNIHEHDYSNTHKMKMQLCRNSLQVLGKGHCRERFLQKIIIIINIVLKVVLPLLCPTRYYVIHLSC